MRAAIVDRAKKYCEDEPAEVLEGDLGRTRKGQKLSKPAHNREGQSEANLKQLHNSDRVWTCRLKKRHRKGLSIEEIE